MKLPIKISNIIKKKLTLLLLFSFFFSIFYHLLFYSLFPVICFNVFYMINSINNFIQQQKAENAKDCRENDSFSKCKRFNSWFM